MVALAPYLDSEGRIKEWPAKRHGQRRELMLQYLLGVFEQGKHYTEVEVNALLRSRHAFDDPAYLRRELVDRRMLKRLRDCTSYWLPLTGR
jgi:hypothetical protein